MNIKKLWHRISELRQIDGVPDSTRYDWIKKGTPPEAPQAGSARICLSRRRHAGALGQAARWGGGGVMTQNYPYQDGGAAQMRPAKPRQ